MTRKILEDYKLLAIQKNGEYTSNIIPNKAHDKTVDKPWKCEKGHTWDACYTQVKSRSWCPVCAGNLPKTIEDYIFLANEIHILILYGNVKKVIRGMRHIIVPDYTGVLNVVVTFKKPFMIINC